MSDTDPTALRQIFFDAWHKALKQQPLSPMEAIIVDIIERHPEYHALFSTEHFDSLSQERFQLDSNPFFHLALHVTIAEQVGADRPSGIRKQYLRLMTKYQDKTTVEHKMIDCLTQVLVANFQTPDAQHEQHYLDMIARIS